MTHTIPTVRKNILSQIATSDTPSELLKSKELKSLYAEIPTLAPDDRATYGKALNELKIELVAAIQSREEELQTATLPRIDVTAPFDVNSELPRLSNAEQGSIHPMMREIDRVIDIFNRMGFMAHQSREIDDQFNMFETLNFPKDHPARDEYDTFMTTQTDANGDSLIAPAHTSTMQHRILKHYAQNLALGEPIAAVVADRVFRNEDVDARHEHTFYQIEGMFVGENINVGMLVATLKSFLEEYYGKVLEVRINPFYFPFTEPSFEMALSCPFCDKTGCKVCSFEGWIELLGCGMIHPNVLRYAGIDAEKYSGFAWGCGIDRLVMMKYGIEDVRHFKSGKLDFLRQF